MTQGTLDTCRRFEDFLPEILDLDGEDAAGTLPLEERETLLRHAAGCERCSEALRTYRRTVEILRDLPRHAAPPDFLGWVREAAGGRPTPSAAPRSGRARPLTWRRVELLWSSLAALLLVAVTATFFLPPPGEKMSPPREAETALAVMDADGADSPPAPARAVSSRSPPETHPVSFTLEVSPEASPALLAALEADLRTEFERRPPGALRLERSAELPRELLAKRQAAPPAAASEAAASGAQVSAARSDSRGLSRSAPSPRALGEWSFKVPAGQVEALRERLDAWAREREARVSTAAAPEGASNDATAASSPPLPPPSPASPARPEGETSVVEVRIIVRSR